MKQFFDIYLKKPSLRGRFFALIFGLISIDSRGQNIEITLPDSAGGLWVGRKDGLFFVDSNGVSTRVLYDLADSMGRKRVAITTLKNAPDGKIWIGTMGCGLYNFDPEMRKKTHFFHKKEKNSLPSDTILCIFQGREMWVATPAGLAKWLAPLDIFRNFEPPVQHARKFWPSKIEQDLQNSDRLLITTDDGIFTFNKISEKFGFTLIPYEHSNPILLPVSNAVKPISGAKLRDNSDSFFIKIWPWFAAVSGILSLGWWFLKTFENKIRRSEQLKYNIQEAENQLLRSQINSQFIFNSLNSIKNHVLSNDKFLAADYLSGFANLMHNILEHSRSERIPLRDELDTLRLYVSLEQLRFKRKFDFDLRVDSKISPEDLLVQPLILQPFVEAAIRHGIQKKEGKGQILVEIYQKNEFLVYKIEDNGISRMRKEAVKAATSGDHEELRITRDRMLLQQNAATIEWVDLGEESPEREGTRVEISMKMLDENQLSESKF